MPTIIRPRPAACPLIIRERLDHCDLLMAGLRFWTVDGGFLYEDEAARRISCLRRWSAFYESFWAALETNPARGFREAPFPPR